MAAYPYGGSRGRVAASNYRVLSIEAGGGAAVVEWKLDTGRTHQIRCKAADGGAHRKGVQLKRLVKDGALLVNKRRWCLPVPSGQS